MGVTLGLKNMPAQIFGKAAVISIKHYIEEITIG
jgi:hypothetical protein